MTRTVQRAPGTQGFRMPGEFEPHAGCWMLWPERPDNWRLGAQPAQAAFAAVAAAIARFEPVTVGVSRPRFAHARSLLAPGVRVVELPSNDAWMRDVGPTFVVDAQGQRRGIDWHFNAWGGTEGGLYSPWDLDDCVAAEVLRIEGVDRHRAPLVLEGGAIHVDGEGTCITTEECLLNPNRNPTLDRAQIETHLRDYLGVKTIVWLGQGVYNDETDGHVDNLCCFVRPGVVCLSWTEDRGDPQYSRSQDAFERLSRARDARGRPFEIHKLPQPGPLYATAEEASGIERIEGSRPRQAGDRLAGSYVNFYLPRRVGADGGVVLPLLDPKHDREVMSVVQGLFPEREIVGVQAREILLGGGNIHCITQQVPAAVSAFE